MLSALGIVVVDWAVGGQWAEPKMCRKHKPKLFYRFENEAGKPKKSESSPSTLEGTKSLKSYMDFVSQEF